MRLIDILNKIANGEFKEGTKVKHNGSEYEYREGNLWLNDGDVKGIVSSIDIHRVNDEVELIEPNHSPDVGKMAEHFREDTKMIEPTDNTKIEELELGNTYLQDAIIQLTDKLNEVINKVNAQTTVVLSQEKDIEEIKNQLYY